MTTEPTGYANEISTDINRLKHFIDRKFRWFSRSVLFILTALIVSHAIHPGILDWVSDLLKIERPSLGAILALMILVFVLERVVLIEGILARPPVKVYATRTNAYRDLPSLISERSAGRLDLIQFSGQRALAFLRDFAERRPHTRIRIALMDPAHSEAFDHDNKPNHRERISTTTRELELLSSDFEKEGLTVEWRYYSVAPSISAVLVDDWLVCLSWYYCYPDDEWTGIVRLRGHLAPAIIAIDEHSTHLAAFARKQFDLLWRAGASP